MIRRRLSLSGAHRSGSGRAAAATMPADRLALAAALEDSVVAMPACAVACATTPFPAFITFSQVGTVFFVPSGAVSVTSPVPVSSCCHPSIWLW
ncbi:hypothetical protein D3C77_673650 [compost metagenome]